MSQSNYEDEDYFIPLEDQRVFGAGIKRKRVPFVRASDDLQTTSAPPVNQSVRSVADIYSSIVLSKRSKKGTEQARELGGSNASVPHTQSISAPVSLVPSPKNNDDNCEPRINIEASVTASIVGASGTDLCEVCKLPIIMEKEKVDNDELGAMSTTASNTPHEASIVHQVCLQHSHPPSHLDRNRHGLRYLTSYGWDPDSRTGLGAEGRTGILQPIKPKAKTTTSGLGLAVKDEESIAAKKNTRKQQQEQRQKLNAKQVRLREMADKKKAEKLRELFYASDDIQRYLGSGSGT